MTPQNGKIFLLVRIRILYESSPMSVRDSYANHLQATNVSGSGKASSYVRALELLQQMLSHKPCGFDDCRDLWNVDSIDRLEELRLRVLAEAKIWGSSAWNIDGLPRSYFRDGYCSAALRSFQKFLVEYRHDEELLRITKEHRDDESTLSEKLNIEPNYPEFLIEENEGRDAIKEAKIRINQSAFRKITFWNYENKCCITELEILEVNRASHIIGWAENKDTRMDPRNGLCLSATYDAAFDRKLISLDDDYRIILSRSLRDRVPSKSIQDYFFAREGMKIRLPQRYLPLRTYLETHRRGGDF